MHHHVDSAEDQFDVDDATDADAVDVAVDATLLLLLNTTLLHCHVCL